MFYLTKHLTIAQRKINRRNRVKFKKLVITNLSIFVTDEQDCD